MARDINKRLANLKVRRRGAPTESLLKSLLPESYEKRSSKSYTRYALGAMQAVDDDYTRIGLETAERIGKQLHSGLKDAGNPVEFRLQGSVPLNVHIRGVSDVDLLVLDSSFLTYAVGGARAQASGYTDTPKTSVAVLSTVRTEAVRILRAKFPATTVDTSGSKAIRISGGSLARQVDVVPSHWHDNIPYQTSGAETDRGVTILDSKLAKTIANLPFLHIKRIGDRDIPTLGGLRKAIRLCKSVKGDAEADGATIVFPSFDIAATMYHAHMGTLAQSAIYELAVLVETQRFLDWLTRNEAEAQKLEVPDGSRKIFDSAEKLHGLRLLSIEMDDLLKEVALEQKQPSIYGGISTLQEGRDILAKTYIPPA